jgi:hypothetical protein
VTVKKYVTKEYHEGQTAYTNGFALTTNPYLKPSPQGDMWYWMFGWQDAMADELREIKQLILMAGQPIDKGRMN